MPDKKSVTVGFRSRQQDGETVLAGLPGELFRLTEGWALAYKEPPDENGKETNNTLFVRAGELRLRRRGTVDYEQVFRVGENGVPGEMTTPYGSHAVMARTFRLASDLSEAGGWVEWEYELMLHDQTAGNFHVRLDIKG
ncbi:DUF1934 domain-containing protein [Cohnella soli]|uniref:DUF1934 domain-containing protein n=1 Tax=Cohnella soli TaxID=425005 RepID=A0ABW0HQL4_9BACL